MRTHVLRQRLTNDSFALPPPASRYTKSREVVAARARKRDVEKPKEGGDEAPV